jgi:predicted nuclease of predicted toxin-antitoxin system
MRLLIDNPVSPQVKSALAAAGHDAVHVRDVGLAAADDRTILELARQEDRVLISQDTDFGALLAADAASKPSLILLRLSDARPANHIQLLVTVLPVVENQLLQGAIVVITDKGIRIRLLPIA